LRLSAARACAEGSRLVTSIPAFFFQAEDGIRDDLVTGVQTCALPISIQGGRLSVTSSPHIRVPPGSVALTRRSPRFAVSFSFARSEERRVGKEAGGLWAALEREEKGGAGDDRRRTSRDGRRSSRGVCR